MGWTAALKGHGGSLRRKAIAAACFAGDHPGADVPFPHHVLQSHLQAR